MKTIYLSSLFLASFFSVKAQHYFPSDSVKWRMNHEYMDAGVVTHHMVDYTFLNDTIHRGGLVFKKLNEISFNSYGMFRGQGGPFLHVDTVAKRVYCILDLNDSVPTLLYDFSLTVGDSMETFEHRVWPLTWSVVEDSTIMISGGKRRYLKVERPAGIVKHQDIWIEGIGSIYGLFAPVLEIPFSFEFGFNLACFTDSSAGIQYQPLDFFNDTYFNCNSVFSLREGNISSMIKAYPNPSHEELVLENSYNETLDFVIYSQDGKLTHKVNISPQSKQVLMLSGWKPGIYYVEVRDETRKSVYNFKINHF